MMLDTSESDSGIAAAMATGPDTDMTNDPARWPDPVFQDWFEKWIEGHAIEPSSTSQSQSQSQSNAGNNPGQLSDSGGVANINTQPAVAGGPAMPKYQGQQASTVQGGSVCGASSFYDFFTEALLRDPNIPGAPVPPDDSGGISVDTTAKDGGLKIGDWQPSRGDAGRRRMRRGERAEMGR